MKSDCPVCGEAHPRCHGHTRNPVKPCMAHPRDEETLCRVHGGNSPAHRAKGEARRALKAAEADAQAKLGFALDGTVPDVLAAMEGLAAMSLAMVEALSMRVNAVDKMRFTSDYGIEQIRAEVTLLERSIDRAGKMLELVAKHKPDGEAAAAKNLLTALAEKLEDLG